MGGSGIGAGALPVVTSHGGAHRGSFVSVGLEQALSAHVSMRVAYTQMQFNSGGVTVTASRGYGGPRVEMFTVGFGIHF